MVCAKLINDLDLNCIDFYNRYYQNVILINKSDVQDYVIYTNDLQHRISFNLFSGKYGKLFTASEMSNTMKGTFSKTTNEGIPFYQHSVQVPVIGVSEYIKILLKQLDTSDYFAAIQFTDGNIEIYGFEYGLTTSGYNYEAQSTLGGSVITLESRYDEYVPPLMYVPKIITPPNSVTEQATLDFDNLFGDIPVFNFGDFNDDFNDDFNNQT